MTDPTALAPVPGVVDLHARLQAGETLFGTFLEPRLAGRAEIVGSGRLRLGDHRPRARRRHRIGAARPTSTRPVRRATAALVRPQSGRAAADRAGPRPRRARDHGPADRPARTGARGGLVHALPARRRPRARAVDTRRRARSAGARRHPGDQRRILGIIQIESPSAVEHAAEIAAIDGVDVLFVGPTDLSHSLGRPGPVRRPGLPRRAAARRSPRPRPPARPPGSCSTTPPSSPRHRELGFRFIGLGGGRGVRHRRRAGDAGEPRGLTRRRHPPRVRLGTPRSASASTGIAGSAHAAGAAPSARPRTPDDDAGRPDELDRGQG